MLRELNSKQISEWQAYNDLEPIGEWRADVRLAFLSSLITNIARAVHCKKGTEMTTPDDFLIKWDKEETEKGMKRQSVQEMKRILESIASGFKGNKTLKSRTK